VGRDLEALDVEGDDQGVAGNHLGVLAFRPEDAIGEMVVLELERAGVGGSGGQNDGDGKSGPHGWEVLIWRDGATPPLRTGDGFSVIVRGDPPGCQCKNLDNSAGAYYNHIVMKPTGYAMTPSASLDATFAALADPTRRAILARL